MDQKKIGQFIAQLRKEQSMTQKELARRIGVSDKTVSKWETGRGLPEVSIMQSLCDTLGITVNELLSGQRLDETAWREKAEENLAALMRPKHYKKLIAHFAISTLVFLLAFALFPLAAERMIDPLLIPVGLFWSILLIVVNFTAGMVYAIVKRWGVLRLIFSSLYHIGLLYVLITLLAMAGIVFFAG